MKWFAVFGMAAVLGLTTAEAVAGNAGRAAPPPLVLSPNLTEPWVLQLRPKTRRTVRYAPRVRMRQHSTGVVRTTRTVRHQPRQQPKQVRKQRQVAPEFLPRIVDYHGPYSAGHIVIDTQQRFLYLVGDNGTARRYGVGVGKPGFEWAGTHKITRKAEWPDWRPPAEMRKRRPELPTFMAGGPENPLGARALYLGSTLYRIHGSNQPWTIGHAVSSGCIRMRNEDVMDLYQRVGVGTKVHVI